jgi:putative peptidoglycan lipid II flippase
MLFEHGAFTAGDTAATAQALIWLALGLPAHVLVKALSPAFFARGNTLTPFFSTLKGLAVAVVLAVVLGHLYGATGIAASIALGAWSSATTLIRHGAVNFGFSIDAAARRRLPRIVVAALAMGGVLWLTTTFAPVLSPNTHGIVQAVFLGMMIAAVIAIYGLLLLLFGAIAWGDVVSAVRKPVASDLRD